MDLLRLVALDEQDLTIVSAHVQDAVTKVGDLKYLESARSFVVPMNRFAWEAAGGRLTAPPQRRNSVLHFDRVASVRHAGVARDRPAETLSLLAVGFEPGDLPAGVVTLTFSGGAAIRLEVECIEGRLTDLGGAWQATSRPRHDI